MLINPKLLTILLSLEIRMFQIQLFSLLSNSSKLDKMTTSKKDLRVPALQINNWMTKVRVEDRYFLIQLVPSINNNGVCPSTRLAPFKPATLKRRLKMQSR